MDQRIALPWAGLVVREQARAAGRELRLLRSDFSDDAETARDFARSFGSAGQSVVLSQSVVRTS